MEILLNLGQMQNKLRAKQMPGNNNHSNNNQKKKKKYLAMQLAG